MRIDKETLELYLKFDDWSIRDAALILMGFNPELVKGLKVNLNSRLELVPPEFHQASKLSMVFKRSNWTEYGGGTYSTPRRFTWFLKMALDKQIDIDEPTLDLIGDWLEKREDARSEDGNTTSHILRTDERQSLYKIIIGWAIGIYNFDPKKRNSRLTEMRKDIERSGLSLDDDTLRKWLKEAASVLPKKFGE